MCDSDDTDVLLLIPPDFFVVPSSDDSLGPTPRLSYKSKDNIHTNVVNKLLSQVNVIQNRLSIIESQSESLSMDNSFKSPTCFTKELISPKSSRRTVNVRSRLSLNDENFRKALFTSPQATPKKPLRRLRERSLPSTPSTCTDYDDKIKTRFAQIKHGSPSSTNLTSRYDPSGNSFDSLNATFSPPKHRLANSLSLKDIDARYNSQSKNLNSNDTSPVKYNSDKVLSSDGEEPAYSNHVCQNKAVLNEIQNFLRSVDCIKSHITGNPDSTDSSIDLSFITSPQFKAIAEQHFNRKIVGTNKTIKIKKCRRSKIPKHVAQLVDKTSEPNVLGAESNDINDPNYTKSEFEMTMSLINSPDQSIINRTNIETIMEPSIRDSSSAENLKSSPNKLVNEMNTLEQALYVVNSLKDEEAKGKKVDTNAENKKVFSSNNIVTSYDNNLKNTERNEVSNQKNSMKQNELCNIEKNDNLKSTNSAVKIDGATLNQGSTQSKDTLQMFFDQALIGNDLQKTKSGHEMDEASSTILNEELLNEAESIHDKARNLLSRHKLICEEERHVINRWQDKKKHLQDIDKEISSTHMEQDVLNKWKELQSYVQDKKLFENRTNDESLPNAALLSLKSLWTSSDQNETVLSGQRVEEERFRREHCERLIEALQVRLLESQEKLSVAVKVDAAKDNAIEKLKDACLISQERCKMYETERDKAIIELKEVQRLLQAKTEDTNRKIQLYEQEINESQNECHQLKSHMQEMKATLEETLNENKALIEQVSYLQNEIKNDKQLMDEIRNAATETKQMITASQSEIIKLQEERSVLQRALISEKEKITQLENRTKSLENCLESSAKHEAHLIAEKQNLLSEADRIRDELRLFYQKQLDTVVKEKLSEFQEQLDTAEKAMEERLNNAKLDVAKTAAQFMRDTVERHKLEIRLLEERHSEELKLCNLKKQQTEVVVESLKNKLHRQNLNRAKLASKLHDLMETQWREALRIVTNNGSPFNGSEISLIKQDSVANIEKLLLVNCDDEIIKLEGDRKFDLRKSTQNRPHSAPNEIPTSDKNKGCVSQMNHWALKSHPLTTAASATSDNSDIPFCNEDQLTFRSVRSDYVWNDNCTNKVVSDLTPITSRRSKFKDVSSDSDIQKYMKMLLDKPQNYKSNMQTTKNLASGDYENGVEIDDKFNTKGNKEQKNSKPPWK